MVRRFVSTATVASRAIAVVRREQLVVIAMVRASVMNVMAQARLMAAHVGDATEADNAKLVAVRARSSLGTPQGKVMSQWEKV